MRLIHTADIHLDTTYSPAAMPGSFGNSRRQSLRDVLSSILLRAREWPADAVLIAGDLFDHDYVSRDTIAFLRAQFEGLNPIPVFIAPGNHDPYLSNSAYATEKWPDNVVIFSQPSWSAHSLLGGRLIVHGFGFDGYEPSSNPWGSLQIEHDGAIHVGVGHGTERAHQPPDGKSYAPFDAAAVSSPSLYYLALGHFHAMTEIRGDFSTRMYYSGAPEGHDFSETGPHHYLEVDVDEKGVNVRPVESARVIFSTHSIDCGAFTNSQDLIDALRQIARQSNVPQVARVTLDGSCPHSLTSEIGAVHDAAVGEFAFLDLIDNTVQAEDYEALARETTTLGEFVRRLNQQIHDAPDEARRLLLERVREVGFAAYRGDKLPVRGLDVVHGGGAGLAAWEKRS